MSKKKEEKYYGQPSESIKRYFSYIRKAAVTRNPIKRFIYEKLADYYDRKHMKEFMSS